ncbi:NAD-dependent epimerase/dehydratase family protein [bacterium]|nr:NAD-dependent epimerase/dehydratase family protein [bacterium]
MKVLFIGGTGIISSACSELALERNIELTLLIRGISQRTPPHGARVFKHNIQDTAGVQRVLEHETFDAVVNWINFTVDQVERDIHLFRGKTGQYVFISSASVYQKPPSLLPITESTPLFNPYWQYSRDKIACEERLLRAFREERFPVTIVRPSHTYDKTLLPFHGRYTVIDRMRKGRPVIVHGDGTSLWTLTHHRDFAVGLIGLLGNRQALGHAFHITSDELLTWNQIHAIMGQAAGAEPKIIHVPSAVIARFDAEWGANLLGDKAHCMIFDNSKIRRFVPDFNPSIPFHQGAREIMAWYDEDPSRRTVNPELDRIMDNMVKLHERA